MVHGLSPVHFHLACHHPKPLILVLSHQILKTLPAMCENLIGAMLSFTCYLFYRMFCLMHEHGNQLYPPKNDSKSLANEVVLEPILFRDCEKDRCIHDEDRCTYDEDRCPHDEDMCTYDEDRCAHDEDRCTYDEDRCAYYEDRCTLDEDRCTYYEDRCTHYEDRCTHEEDMCTHEEDRCTHYEDRCTHEEDRCTR